MVEVSLRRLAAASCKPCHKRRSVDLERTIVALRNQPFVRKILTAGRVNDTLNVDLLDLLRFALLFIMDYFLSLQISILIS